ncbi:MAG: hypothetical protein ACLVIY_07550 [Anaerobutyricum soehngenii]
MQLISGSHIDLHLGNTFCQVGIAPSKWRIFSIEKIQINGEEISLHAEAEEIPHMCQQLIQKMMEGGHA